MKKRNTQVRELADIILKLDTFSSTNYKLH